MYMHFPINIIKSHIQLELVLHQIVQYRYAVFVIGSLVKLLPFIRNWVNYEKSTGKLTLSLCEYMTVLIPLTKAVWSLGISPMNAFLLLLNRRSNTRTSHWLPGGKCTQPAYKVPKRCINWTLKAVFKKKLEKLQSQWGPQWKVLHNCI